MKKIKQERGRLGQKQQLLPCSNETDLLREASQYRLLGRSRKERLCFVAATVVNWVGRGRKRDLLRKRVYVKYDSLVQNSST